MFNHAGRLFCKTLSVILFTTLHNCLMRVNYNFLPGLEEFDPDFAQSIIDNPEVHIDAANNALNQILRDEGYGNLNPMVRIIHLPKYQGEPYEFIDDMVNSLQLMLSSQKFPQFAREFTQHFRMYVVVQLITFSNQMRELIEPLECNTCEKTKSQTKFVLLDTIQSCEFSIY